LKTVSWLIILAALCSLCGSVSAADDLKGKVPCAVCGYLVDAGKARTAVYEGQTYYFCEAGCKAYFLKDPAAVAAGMDTDPVCGMAVKKEGSVEAVFGGRQMHFCSADCRDKYLANPAEYEMNYDVVSNEVRPQKEMTYTLTFEGRPYFFVSEENRAAFEKNPDAYVYAECPVTGNVFLRKDAGARTDYKGVSYYFCSKGCLEKFEKDPTKYMVKPASIGSGSDRKVEKVNGGVSAEAGCPAKKTGVCPKAKTCKKS
jgi:YHS domain-containing protein